MAFMSCNIVRDTDVELNIANLCRLRENCNHQTSSIVSNHFVSPVHVILQVTNVHAGFRMVADHDDNRKLHDSQKKQMI